MGWLSSAVPLTYSHVIAAKDLWENITHIMTDSVSKNLKIEDLVAEKLSSKHAPYHLLCKSHVVEKLDASNLDVLAASEERVKLRQHLEAINPALKPFFRGKKTVVVAGIQAILMLVSYGKNGNSSSLAEEFDVVTEREGAVKHAFISRKKIREVRIFCCINIASFSIALVPSRENMEIKFTCSGL